jgi:stage V sporulation protein B
MLQAMDLAFVSVITMTLGAICKTVLSLVLVGNPKIGIIGAPIGTLVCYIVICIPNLFFVMKAVKATPILFGGFVAPLIASTIMAICGWGSYKLLVILFLDTPAALMSFVVAGVTYVAAAILLGAIAKQDLLLLPKGRQIAKFLKIH